jgi:hypothetical protein
MNSTVVGRRGIQAAWFEVGNACSISHFIVGRALDLAGGTLAQQVLSALLGPGESYSDVIIRLAAAGR